MKTTSAVNFVIRVFVVGMLLCLAPTGCNKKESGDKVVLVKEDDAKMNEAIAKSRATVGQFILALKAHKPTQTDLSVKMAFVQGDQTEYMWLADVTFDGKAFHGTVNNDPEMVTNVKIGQKASVESTKISDWMYLENGKLVGGYSIRVLRDQMSVSERAEFDKSAPFKVE